MCLSDSDDCFATRNSISLDLGFYPSKLHFLKLQRQHLLLIPLSRQIREKLAHETLDNSQMKINGDNYYK